MGDAPRAVQRPFVIPRWLRRPSPIAAERERNNFNGFEVFYLKVWTRFGQDILVLTQGIQPRVKSLKSSYTGLYPQGYNPV